MRGSAVFRTGVVPGGALAPAWVRDALWRNARAVPSLDLRFADNKSLVDATTGQNLVTFTRASSGTYVGSDGVLKMATTNFLLRSEEFDNAAAWQNQGSTDAANSTTAPNGTLTADEVIEDSSTGNHYITQSFTSTTGIVYTFSCYVKAANRAFCFLGANGAGTVQFVSVNLSTGVASSATGSPSNITSVSIGNGWYRVSFTYTSGTTGAVGHEVRLSTDGVWANRSYTGNGTGSVYAWGAQLEQSSAVGEYIPTTSTINSAPRFGHNPTTGESLGLMVEEQRTNSIRNNTMVGAVAGTPGTLPTNWSQSNNTGLAANVIGTGVENGITYIDLRVNGTTTGSGQTNIYPETTTGIAALTAQTWSYAAYFKLQSGSLANVTTIRYALQENTSAGVAVTAGAQTLDIPATALGSYRPVFTRTLSGGATVAALQPYIQININTGLVIDFTLRIGLPQLEQGAFATSVIPTTTVAATRNADVASITGTNFSSWYRQDTGTFFADATLPYTVPGTQFPFLSSANDGTTANRVDIGYITPNVVGLEVATGGVTQAGIYPNISSAISSRRVAGTYALNDFAVAANTTSVGTDTSGTVPTVTQLRIGDRTGAANNYSNGTIRRLTYWPARLPNSTLQAITQ